MFQTDSNVLERGSVDLNAEDRISLRKPILRYSVQDILLSLKSNQICYFRQQGPYQ